MQFFPVTEALSSATLDQTPIAASAAGVVCGLLAQATPARFAVAGPSMGPLLRDGDEVIVRPATAADVRRGQLVLFRQHGRLTLHRCVGRGRAGELRTAADAAVQGVETVPPDRMLGVAVQRYRQGRARRLDTLAVRAGGMARYWVRPLRRWALRWRGVRGRPGATAP